MIRSFDILTTFLKIGLFSFGSATSEVIMEQVVEKKKWLTMEEFRDCLSLAALIPGPFHVNLVGMAGYSISGVAGGLTSIAGFVLPGFTIAAVVATILDTEAVSMFLRQNPGIIAGMLVSVAALLLNVILRLGQRTLPKPTYWVWVGGLSGFLFLVPVQIAAVILGTGLLYLLWSKVTEKRPGVSQ